MSSSIKRRQTAGIALEETAGTAVAPTHYFQFLECTLAEKMAIIGDTQARGSRYAEGPAPVEGKKSGEGKIEICVDPTIFPYFAALALNSISSEVSGDDYKHTSVLTGGNDPLTATIWRGRVVDSRQFSNAVVNSMELSFADDVVKATIDLLSKYPTTQARTATKTALKLYTFKNASLKIDSETFKVQEFSLKIENNVEAKYAPGSNDVDRFIAKEAKISGSFKLLFESTDQREIFEGLTKQAMVLTLTGSDGDSITITIPQFRIENWAEDGGLGDATMESIEFVAEESDESGEEEVITIETVNSVEEYLSES